MQALAELGLHKLHKSTMPLSCLQMHFFSKTEVWTQAGFIAFGTTRIVNQWDADCHTSTDSYSKEESLVTSLGIVSVLLHLP